MEAEGDPEKKPKARPSSVNATRIEVIQENPALKPKNEDVIRFPFIVLLSSSPENSVNFEMINRLLIRFLDEFKYGYDAETASYRV